MCILFEIICFVFLRNGHFHNFVSTFAKVVKLDVENDDVVSSLSNVVHINVEIHIVHSTLFGVANSNIEIHNVVSTLIWCCPTSRCCINQKTTLKQRWNVCWEWFSVISGFSIWALYLKTKTRKSRKFYKNTTMLKYEHVALKTVEMLFKRHQTQNDYSHC